MRQPPPWSQHVLVRDDRHPDTLVEVYGYERPCPGWYGIRAWHVVPMHLRVEFHYPDIVNHNRPGPEVHMCGTFQHPSREYILEVSRQLLTGERVGFLSAADAYEWLELGALYTETVRWSTGKTEPGEGTFPGFDHTGWGYQVWAWDDRQGCPVAQDDIPEDMRRVSWSPAPVAPDTPWNLVPRTP